jgi:tRNA (guanine-N7-)-methyltransferase
VVAGLNPLILDVGFGTAQAVVELAEEDPDVDILACDMHTPGIGDLLACIAERGITNVRVVEADARLVIDHVAPGRLTGVRTFFPDPWPKHRHHRRRLVTESFANTLADRVALGGFWHIATDWAGYATWMQEQIQRSRAWRGGAVPRPAWRPSTRYERRGIAAGRQPIDLWFERDGS